jgi:hypothetical protein
LVSAQDKSSWIAYASLVSPTNRACGPIDGEEALPAMDPVLLNPLIALIAGILILLMPRILNYVVAIYLIAIGIIGLAHHLQ